MDLCKVKITKMDTCLTYALKRTGLVSDLCTYEDIHNHFDQFPYLRFKEKLKKGDILLWDKKLEHIWIANKIDENGLITTESVSAYIHFGVYEGDNLFSDCTRQMAIGNTSFPALRMREIEKSNRPPDWILRKTSEE